MTSETTVTPSRAAIELLLHDDDWIQAEFVAIMREAGFGDRVVVATVAPPTAGRSARCAPGRPPYPAERQPVAGFPSAIPGEVAPGAVTGVAPALPGTVTIHPPGGRARAA